MPRIFHVGMRLGRYFDTSRQHQSVLLQQRLDSGRVDPEDVINELMEDLQLDSSTAAEGTAR